MGVFLIKSDGVRARCASNKHVVFSFRSDAGFAGRFDESVNIFKATSMASLQHTCEKQLGDIDSDLVPYSRVRSSMSGLKCQLLL